MHDDAFEAFDVEYLTQCVKVKRLIGNLFEGRAFAWCYLTDDRYEHGALAHGYCRDLHRHVEIFQRDMSVTFAKRAFGFQIVSGDFAFDYDFSVGRHFQVDCLAADRAYRRANQPAGNSHFVFINFQFLWSGEQNRRRTTNNNCNGHFFATGLVFQPVLIAASTAKTTGHANPQPVTRL